MMLEINTVRQHVFFQDNTVYSFNIVKKNTDFDKINKKNNTEYAEKPIPKLIRTTILYLYSYVPSNRSKYQFTKSVDRNDKK